MSKLSQLATIRSLGLATPAFRSIRYEQFRSGQTSALVQRLRFPLAVRSTYEEEDGLHHSYAGQFHTALEVEPEELNSAIQTVFDSYPQPEDQAVILQEMVQPRYSGVLFAYPQASWPVEWVAGLGEQLVSGKVQPERILLPRFGQDDLRWQGIFSPWRPFPTGNPYSRLQKPFLQLSAAAGKLLAHFAQEAPHGLDIEFCVDQDDQLLLLQARPITTPQDAEEVLTSANHKEILPPYPSRFMTGLIRDCSRELFAYYHRMDPSLPQRDFIEVSAGMPWINLSALLDVMVSWGLPTALVCESVGAEDPYRVGLRPYRLLRKLPVFLRLLGDQLTVVRRTKKWVSQMQQVLAQHQAARKTQWQTDPVAAFSASYADARTVYVELVSLMQGLTGAMSGPVKLLDQLGALQHLSAQSKSTEYLHAYQQLKAGQYPLSRFLENYGHRGFYESDLGQPRFAELPDAHWKTEANSSFPLQATPRKSLGSILFTPIIRFIHTREWLRHESMRFFQQIRAELQREIQTQLGKEADFGNYLPEDLQAQLATPVTPHSPPSYETAAGWDMDTFLRNRLDRRLPLSTLSNLQASGSENRSGLGIYPGTVTGRIWKVDPLEMGQALSPPFPEAILLTDSLDPGWIPYFVQVRGVLSHVGGLLSHASIILRESRIPAITQVPRQWNLQQGDWVEMNGKTGQVVPVSERI